MTVRLSLALLVTTAAALAYPWSTPTDRWLVVSAVVVVIVVFARWRGLFVTDIARRRIVMWRRRATGRPRRGATPEAAVTALLRIEPSAERLPLPVLAGYVDRYGLRADKVRLISRDVAGERTTWVALTITTEGNLAALQARSPRLPLRATADVAARRLADRLRELGWQVTVPVDPAGPLPTGGHETWRGVRIDTGYVAAYRVAVDGDLTDTLAAIAAHPSAQTWTVVDFTGGTGRLALTAGCVLHSEQRPGAGAPITGLTPEHGAHRAALTAMAPTSTGRLGGRPVPAPAGLLERLPWPTATADVHTGV